MLAHLDADLSAALSRVMRNVYRRLSFDARSAGQRRRYARVPADDIVLIGRGAVYWTETVAIAAAESAEHLANRVAKIV